MNGINPKWGMYLGLAVLLEQTVGHGGAALLTGMVPAEWITYIVAWCNGLAALGTVIMTWQASVSSSAPGPLANTSISPGVKAVLAFLIVSLAMLCMTAESRAADIAAKAPTDPFANLAKGYPYQTSGMYFGAYTQGGGGSVQGTAVGVNANSLTTNEIGLGGTVGWARGFAGSNVFVAAEAMFGWRNFNGSNAGFSLSGPVSFEQRFKIGTPLNAFLSLLPNLGLPTAAPFPAMPNGQTVSNAQAYFMVGFHEDDNSLAYGLQQFKQWTFAPSIGVGVLGQLPNGVAADTWVETVFADKSICAGVFGKCANQGPKVLAGLAFYF